MGCDHSTRPHRSAAVETVWNNGLLKAWKALTFPARHHARADGVMRLPRWSGPSLGLGAAR